MPPIMLRMLFTTFWRSFSLTFSGMVDAFKPVSISLSENMLDLWPDPDDPSQRFQESMTSMC